MLTEQDIQRLIQVFATRDEVATKSDLEKMRQDFSDLQVSVDNYAHKADAYFQEMVAMNSRLNRLERWVQELAKKVNLELVP